MLHIGYYFNRDEDPIGNWTIKVIDDRDYDKNGTFEQWSLHLFGESIQNSTVKPPLHIPTNDVPKPLLNNNRNNPYFAFIIILIGIILTISLVIYRMTKRTKKQRVLDPDEEFERLVNNGDFDAIALNDIENQTDVLFNQQNSDDDY